VSELPTKSDLLSTERALRRAAEAAMMLRDVIDAAIRALDIRAGDADLEESDADTEHDGREPEDET
jgi:hypothetical protein